ncbi:MAG: PspC domain-containing protein [Parcubacteria group bacterium]|nr:PspC domain-containing protein [Parcubacteria group bacterium]
MINTKTRKKLCRSSSNKIVAGVIGGLAEYFEDRVNIDPVIWRVAYVLITAFTGFAPGIVAYLVLALIIPKQK